MPKNSKRANGEGSIFQRDGKYIAQLCIGKNENGKRAFKTATASTKTEAVEKLNELKEKYGKISSVEMAKAPLYTIIGKWFEDKKNPVLYQKAMKSNSIDRIESTMNTHVIAAIGDIPVNEIRPADIQSVIDSIGIKGLSFSTAKKIYDYTSSLFNYAVDMEYIGKSPMKRVRLCRDKFPEAKKIDALTDDEVRALKEAATVKYGNGKLVYDCGYAIPIMLETGLRVGEILALRWSRVHMDGENPYIDVIDNAVEVKDRSNGGKISLTIDTPKSKSSRRRVPLTSEAVKWFMLQKENMYFGENSFVFNVRTGEEHPVKPSHLRRAFDKMQERAGLDKKRLHQLRHTFASRLNAKEVPLLTISKLLGHSSINSEMFNTTTLGYIDVSEEQFRKAILKLESNNI